MGRITGTDLSKMLAMAMADNTAKLRSMKKAPAHREALARVREWTRERFGLPEEASILVAELACRLPGCPPLETVVAFWTEDDRRHQFKLFKPVRDVVDDDLPYAWLIEALVASELPDCC